jgi:hypothetical protein
VIIPPLHSDWRTRTETSGLNRVDPQWTRSASPTTTPTKLRAQPMITAFNCYCRANTLNGLSLHLRALSQTNLPRIQASRWGKIGNAY